MVLRKFKKKNWGGGGVGSGGGVGRGGGWSGGGVRLGGQGGCERRIEVFVKIGGVGGGRGWVGGMLTKN